MKKVKSELKTNQKKVEDKMIQKKAKGGAIDGLNQHKALAMGKPVTGKKKGGSVC